MFDYDLTFQTPLLAVIVPALPPGAWTVAVTGEADAVPPPAESFFTSSRKQCAGCGSYRDPLQFAC